MSDINGKNGTDEMMQTQTTRTEYALSERKVMYKWWWAWDFDKEEDWLNEMAFQGWALTGVRLCRYEFQRCECGEYIIRLEMRDQENGYLDLMKESGAEYVGRVVRWMYFRRKAELGDFKIFSDLDSVVSHLTSIYRMLFYVGLANLFIGAANAWGSASKFSVVNLLLGALCMYGAGLVKGKREAVVRERRLHE